MRRRLVERVVAVLLFLGTGEGMVRLDETGWFFAESGTQTVRSDMLRSSELEALDRQLFVPSPADLRIMIIGDSKLRGLGVRPDEVISQQLEGMLQQQLLPQHRTVHVLNLSRAGNNTLQNKMTFFRYYRAYKPQIVVLGYNIDDVYGDNGNVPSAAPVTAVTGAKTHSFVPASVSPLDVTHDVVHGMTRALFHSHALAFALSKTNMELKLAGVILPGTEFHHLVRDSHRQDYQGWTLTQQHLDELLETCRAEGIAPVVYLVPQLEMLPHFEVFRDVDGAVEAFFKDRGVPVIHGVEPFHGQDPVRFALSRYDGHPNAAAHHLIARQLAGELGPLVSRFVSGGSIQVADDGRSAAVPTSDRRGL